MTFLLPQFKVIGFIPDFSGIKERRNSLMLNIFTFEFFLPKEKLGRKPQNLGKETEHEKNSDAFTSQKVKDLLY